MVGKKKQEDAYAVTRLPKKTSDMEPEEIGKRIWTTHRNLAKQMQSQGIPAGTTACTTVITKNSLVTATIADTLAFAIIYGKNGERRVEMLTQRIISPWEKQEKIRAKSKGGIIFEKGKHKNCLFSTNKDSCVVNSRSIGDFKYPGVCADSDISILNLEDYQDAEKIQIVTACDGFFDPIFIITEHLKNATDEKKRKYYETYVDAILSKYKGDQSEASLAKHLAETALRPVGLHTVIIGGMLKPSHDNITVTIQTIQPSPELSPRMLGVYDGHGGEESSTYVAEHIGQELTKTLNLSQEEYEQYENSVNKHEEDYVRDNPPQQPEQQTELSCSN